MKDYLKSFHESLQDLKVNTYVELGFCCHKTIRNDLRQRLISMQQRHSQIFVMMLNVRLPGAYADAVERDRLFSSFLTDFISNERDCYGDVEFVWRFEPEDKITRMHERKYQTKVTGMDWRGMWRLVLFYNGDAHGSTSHRKHAEKFLARTLNLDTAAGLIHVNAPKSDQSYRHDGFVLRKDDPELKGKVKSCFEWISYLARVIKGTLKDIRTFGASEFQDSKKDKPC